MNTPGSRSSVSVLQDVAASYLIVSGALYVVAGIFGLVRNGDLVAIIFWQSLISPYPLISYLEATVHHYPWDLRLATINDVPYGDFKTSSALVVVAGAIAAFAAIAMMMRKVWAKWVWTLCLLLSFICACGYVLAALAVPDFGLQSSIRPFCLWASYFGAFLLARSSGWRARSRDRSLRSTRPG